MFFFNGIFILFFIISIINALNLSDIFKFRQKRINENSVVKRAASENVIIVLHEDGNIFGLENTKVFHFAILPSNNFDSSNLNESFIEPSLMEIEEIYKNYETKPRNDITHVANGGKYTVYAMVEKNKEYLKNVTRRFFQDAEKSNWQMPEIPSFLPFTQIRSGAFEGFKTGANKNEKVFITAFSHDPITGKIEKIADAYEVMAGSGVVIGYDNKIHDVINGKLWVDPTGKSHSRRPQNV